MRTTRASEVGGGFAFWFLFTPKAKKPKKNAEHINTMLLSRLMTIWFALIGSLQRSRLESILREDVDKRTHFY